MTDKERKSCIRTIEILRGLAFNVHGVMDIIDAQNCDKVIEMLNEPEPHWIPCSERLPDVGAILLSDGNEIVIGEYYGDNTWKVDGCDYDPILEEIAWMPLLEPYKGEGDHHDD